MVLPFKRRGLPSERKCSSVLTIVLDEHGPGSGVVPHPTRVRQELGMLHVM